MSSDGLGRFVECQAKRRSEMGRMNVSYQSGSINKLLRLQPLPLRRRKLAAYLSQPIPEANDFRHFEVVRGGDEIIRVMLAHALTARSHQSAGREVAGDQ